MLKYPPTRRPGLPKWTHSALAILALAQSALGVITVHFVETGPDVVVSFNGSLALPGNPHFPIPATFDSGYTLLEDCIFTGLGTPDQTDQYLAQGTPTVSTITHNVDGGGNTPADVGLFGFLTTALFFQEMHVTGGSIAGGVTEITATPAKASFTVSGVSLSDLFQDPGNPGVEPVMPNGTVLWTAN